MKGWLVVTEGSRAGTTLELGREPATIGREPGATLHLGPTTDLSVSGRHAVVEPSDSGWTIRDLGSTNGTWIEGERIEDRRVLRPGDRIRLGLNGPLLLFTDRDPADSGVPVAGVPRTATGPAFGVSSRTTGLVAAGLVLAAVIAAGVALRGSGSGDASPAEDPEAGVATATAEDAAERAPRDGAADGAGEESPATDTTNERLQREVAELRSRVLGLDRQLREALRESDALRDELEQARARGASEEEVEELERRLQQANAALQRQRLAASLDIDRVSTSARPATSQVYVEFDGGRVVAATAFGVGSDGLLVTNGHVVTGSDGEEVSRLGVQYAGERALRPAEVVRISDDDDLALLRIRGDHGDLPSIRSFNRNVDTLAAGSPLVLLGYPLGGEMGGASERAAARPLVSVGVLAGATGGLLEIEGYGNVGASGSPVLDASGQVVGVVMGGRRDESGERLFAVSADRLLTFMREAARGG